jgi:hypothetical protein
MSRRYPAATRVTDFSNPTREVFQEIERIVPITELDGLRL